MAKPIIEANIEFSEKQAQLAYARVQNTISKRPLKVQLATDTRSLEGLDKGLGKLSGRADEFTKSLEAANARVLAFGSSVVIISAIGRAFKDLITTTVEVEDAFKKIAVIGDQFTNLEKFGRGLFDVARNSAQSFDVASKAALEFARQGLGPAETLKRVNDALILTRISGLDAASSVEGLTAAVNAFRKEGLTTTDIINKLVAVDNKYAVSSADLIEGIKRSGSFAQDAGLSFDELAATVTVLQEVTARGGSVIGNSLKTIFERVRRPESIQQLQNLGVEVKNVADGTMLPAIKIIDNFAQKLNKLNDTEKQSALRQLAGTFQINQLSALVGVLGEAETASRKYDQVLATAQNSSIEATSANAKLNESLKSQVAIFSTNVTEIASAIGNLSIAPILGDILSSGNSVVSSLIENVTKEGPSLSKAIAKVFGDGLIVAGVFGGAAIVKFVGNFLKFAKDSFSTVLKLNEGTKNQESLQLSILNLLRSRGDIEQALLSAGNNQIAQARVLKGVYEDIAASEARRLQLSNTVAKSLASTFVVGSTGMPTPKGKRASSGYVPDLIRAEYSDIKKGVGGASRNSKVVLINDFPFGGGRKGPMVANTSEGILPMGNSAAVLTKNMMGERAAKGSVPNISLENVDIAAKSGKFISIKKIEQASEALAKTLLEQGKVGLEFINAFRSSDIIKNLGLTAPSLKALQKEALDYSKNLKQFNLDAEKAYQEEIRLNAEKRKAEQEAAALRRAEEKAQKDRLNNLLRNNVNVPKLPPPSEIGAPRDPLTLAILKDQKNLESRTIKEIALSNRNKAFMSVPNLGGSIDFADTSIRDVRLQTQQRLAEETIAEKRFRSSQLEKKNRDKKLLEEARKAQIRQRLGLPDPIPASERRGNITAGLATIDSRIAKNLEALSDSSLNAGKGLNQAVVEFASSTATIFLGASAAKEALSLVGIESTKLVDVVRDAAIAFVAFKKLGEVGGINSSFFSKESNLRKGISLGRRTGGRAITADDFSLLESSKAGRIGAKLGSSGAFNSVSRVASGIASAGSKLIGALPILGQFAAGLFLANSALQAFGIDVPNIIYKTFGGLSESGERAKKGLESLSDSLFENGQYIGRSLKDADRGLSSYIAELSNLSKAEKLGVSTKDKEPAKVASELFVQQFKKSLSGLSVGGTLPTFSEVSTGLGETVTVASGERKRIFADLNADAQEVVARVLQEQLSLSSEELLKIAGATKVKLTGKETIEDLQRLISEKILERSSVSLSLVEKNPTTGGITFGNAVRSFANPRQVEQEKKQGIIFDTVNSEQARIQIANALELRNLQIDFADEAERNLETQIQTSQLNEVEKANLQSKLNVLQAERKISSDIFSTVKDGINDLASSEGFLSGNVLREDLTKSLNLIREMGGTPLDNLAKIEGVFNNLKLSEDGNRILTTLKERLSKFKDISQEQLRQIDATNQQLRLEAQINERIRLRDSLLQSQGELALSRLDSRKAGFDNAASILSAQSSNPALGTSQQRDFRRREIEQQRLSLQTDLDRAAENKRIAESKLGTQNLTFPERGIELRKIEEEYNRTTSAINSQIQALGIQESQIGAVKSGFTALSDSVIQFYESLGELESSSVLQMLQSGDLSSMLSSNAGLKALGDFKVSGKSGGEGISFYNQRLAIRQKEADLSAAQSESQKLQLQRELDLLNKTAPIREEIARIVSSGGNAESKILELIKAQNSELSKQRGVRGGVQEARAQIQEEIANAGNTFGQTATFGFRDALVGAVQAAANSTGSLKDALLNVALEFSNKLRDAALTNLANILTNKASDPNGGILSSVLNVIGGGIQTLASGGKVTGGSGSKDDVPTLLMGGEYVINKKSVQKYGPQFFEKLNNGSIGGMAKGGMFIPGTNGQKTIRGSQNLLNFASQSRTSGKNDIIASSGSGAFVGLEPESFRMSSFARNADSPINQALAETKDQALSLFFQDQSLKKQYKDQLAAQKKAEDEARKQMTTQLLVSLGTTALSSIASSYSKGSAIEIPDGYQPNKVSQRPDSLFGTQYNPSPSFKAAPVQVPRTVIRSNSSASNYSAANSLIQNSLPVGGGMNSFNPLLPPADWQRRASGGRVSGNPYGDGTKAMLNGDEVIVKGSAAKKFGYSNLDAVNNGQTVGVSEEKSKEMNDRVVSKLDELIGAISSTGGGINVSVQMDSEGKTKTQETGNANADQKNLTRRIRDEVVKLLQEEKRLTGVLRGK